MARAADRRLLLFTKPARAGRVKTRLIGDLTARQAADLHAAFLGDLLARLRPGCFDLRLAWALDPAAGAPAVAALGSDHPTLPLAVVHRAFAAVEAGTPVVLGPAADGGYYLIALAAAAVSPRLFAGIPWSTEGVLGETLVRCRELGLAWELLPAASDVDTPHDLARLAGDLAAGDLDCPRTRGLLASWHRLAPAP